MTSETSLKCCCWASHEGQVQATAGLIDETAAQSVVKELLKQKVKITIYEV
jgi:hypothetical protein